MTSPASPKTQNLKPKTSSSAAANLGASAPERLTSPRYTRVTLKLSGEALQDDSESISPRVLRTFAQEIKDVKSLGVEITIVIGGGNIYRGASAAATDIERTTGDYMGMLATVINALAMQAALERIGVHTRVQSAIQMQTLAEPFIRRRALRHLEKGRVVIFAGGTGNPYFSTDTAAALRAQEMGAQVLLKGTKVDGVYDSDPKKNPNAKKFDKLEYLDALQKRLAVMDSTAFSLCMDNHLPIIVFDMFRAGNLKRVVLGEKVGTLISD